MSGVEWADVAFEKFAAAPATYTMLVEAGEVARSGKS